MSREEEEGKDRASEWMKKSQVLQAGRSSVGVKTSSRRCLEFFLPAVIHYRGTVTFISDLTLDIISVSSIDVFVSTDPSHTVP